MVEEIEEKLINYYEFLTIEVNYVKIRTYKIFVSCKMIDYRDSDIIKGIEFNYTWNPYWTIDANIEQIKYDIDKAILKFFRRVKNG